MIFGTRLFGGTDTVPGVFYVATKFFHINFLPLIPLDTYLILQQRGRSFHGATIPMSCKSILLAYIRFFGVIGVIATGIWFFVVASDDQVEFPDLLTALYAFAFATLIASLLMWHKGTRNASYERAIELCSKLRPPLNLATRLLVDAHFQQSRFLAVATSEDNEGVEIANKSKGKKKRRCGAVELEMISGDPIAQKIHEEAENGVLDTFLAEIDEFRGPEGWNMRSVYVSIALESLNQDNKLDWNEMVSVHQQASPGVAAAIRLLQGKYLIECAWDARGSGWAYTVTAEARVRFKAHLEEARDVLLEAATLDPEDPTPFAILQTVAMGLSGRVKAEEWLQQAQERDEFNYYALNSHRYLLMKKWLGCHARESIDFARGVVSTAPKDHLVQMLPISALHEQSTDGAWTNAERQKLMREPWVAETTLAVLKSVYADRPDPPINSIFEKRLFNRLIGWLKLLASNGVMSKETLDHAMAIPQRCAIPEGVEIV